MSNMLCWIPVDVFTHRLARYLDIPSLLCLVSTNQSINQSLSNPSMWTDSSFKPRSLRHLLSVTSSTSSSLPRLKIHALDLSQAGPILSDHHLDLTLRCFPYIKSIDLSSNQRLSIHALTLIGLHTMHMGTSQLTELIYQKPPFTVDCWEIVRLFDHLTKIDLSGASINDQSIIHLSDLTAMTHLVLANCTTLRDSSFKFITNNQIIENSSKHANRHSENHSVDLSTNQPSARSTRSSIKRVSKPSDVWPHLTHLDVSGCVRLTNRSIKSFSFLPALQSINLGSLPRLTPGGLKPLVDRNQSIYTSIYQAVTEISLQSCIQMTDQSIDFLQLMPQLTSLDLRDTPITCQSINQYINQFTELKYLLIDGIDQLDQSILSTILSLRSLEVLSLGYAYHLNSKLLSAAAQSISPKNTRLRVLNLHASSIDSPMFLSRFVFRSIEELDLSGTRLELDNQAINLSIDQLVKSDGPFLPNLHFLSLAHCPNQPIIQSVNVLRFFAIHAPVLCQFDFTHSGYINFEYISHFVSLFPRVLSLALDDNQSIDDACLIVLSSLMSLGTLSLHNCPSITANGAKIFYQSSEANQSTNPSFKQFFSSFVPQSPMMSHLKSLSLPSFDFHLPQSFQMPTVHLPSFSHLSMPTISHPFPNLSMPTISNSFPTISQSISQSFPQLSMPSALRPNFGANLSLESFGSFSSPFSSAFSSLHEDPPSPFLPPPVSPMSSSDPAARRKSSAGPAVLQSSSQPNTQSITSPTNEADRKERNHPMLSPKSESKAWDSSDEATESTVIEENVSVVVKVDQSTMIASTTLSNVQRADQSISQSNNQSIDRSVVDTGFEVPDQPFPSLTFLHFCSQLSKDGKFVSSVRRAHPFCVVEGEGHQNSESSDDVINHAMADIDDSESEEEDENDDISVSSFHDPPSMSHSSHTSRVYESLSFSLDDIDDTASVTSTTAEAWDEDEHHEAAT